MQDRTNDIRAAVNVIANDINAIDVLHEKMLKGERLSDDDQKKLNAFPTADMKVSLEFLVENLLVDIHTIALAQARMAGPVTIIPGKGGGGKADRERGYTTRQNISFGASSWLYSCVSSRCNHERLQTSSS